MIICSLRIHDFFADDPIIVQIVSALIVHCIRLSYHMNSKYVVLSITTSISLSIEKSCLDFFSLFNFSYFFFFDDVILRC